MNLVINEEQQMLKTSAKEFLKEKSPVAALRKLRDTKEPNGYDVELWKSMAEMGWTSSKVYDATQMAANQLMALEQVSA